MAMVSQRQKEFFDNLLDGKEFPPGSPDPDTLRSQFAQLNKKSASEWIDRAMGFPEKGTENEAVTTPPF